MISDQLSAPLLVTRLGALNQTARALTQEPIIAVDTESNSLYAYQEQVCLIQFSTPGSDFLVDPLSIADLSPLGPVFANPQIEKVFHAAEYDVLCLRRDFGFQFANLFDTMIAARILGRDALGLGALLEVEFGIRVDKRHQRANWGQRPLPAYLLAYAQIDTHYLIPLRDRLIQILVENGRWPLAVEDFNRVAHVNGRLPEERVDDCWRISGSYELAPQNAAVLMELCRYRDRVARSANRPLFKVLNDTTLLAIANELPPDVEALKTIPGMTPGQIGRHGRGLLAAVGRGLQAHPVEPPRSPRPSDQFLERLDALRRWRKTKAYEMGVMSDVVLPRDLLNSLAEENPYTADELEGVLKDVPWRFEHFGEQILKVLKRS